MITSRGLTAGAYERQSGEQDYDQNRQRATDVRPPFTDAEAEMRHEHQSADDAHRCGEENSPVRRDSVRIQAEGVRRIVGGYEPNRGDVEHHIHPQIERDEETNGVAECVARPFVKAACDGEPWVKAETTQRWGKKEKRDPQKPQNHMRRAGLYRRAEKIRNDHQQDRSENEVGEAELFSERSGRGRGLQFGNGRRGAAEGGQVSGPGSLSPGKKVSLVCLVTKREAREFR